MKSIVSSLFVGFAAFVVITHARAAEPEISSRELIDLVLSNLNQPLRSPSLAKPVGRQPVWRVKDLLASALEGMAEEGFNESRYDKERKSSDSETVFVGQPSWSRASCEKIVKKQLSELILFMRESPIHHKEFAESLAKYKNQDVFSCKVSWGVDFGEVKWLQELRFFLDSKKKLIPKSFAGNTSP